MVCSVGESPTEQTSDHLITAKPEIPVTQRGIYYIVLRLTEQTLRSHGHEYQAVEVMLNEYLRAHRNIWRN